MNMSIKTSVELVDHMGNDLSVVNAARVSFDKEAANYTDAQNEKLLNYLAKHNHWSPFAHTSVQMRITAPLFVARQLGKHQVGLVWNEVSRRYVHDSPTLHLPDVWRARADNVKQGSSDTHSIQWLDRYTHINTAVYKVYEASVALYQEMLSVGVCPEQARMVLPQSMMTTWMWSGSLLAFHRVWKQRTDPHTQAETQGIAYAIGDILSDLYPVSWKALSTHSFMENENAQLSQ